MARFTETYTVVMGTQHLSLPIVSLNETQAIALLMVAEQPLSVIRRAASELAEALRPLNPEWIVGTATLGIPVALMVAESLHFDQWVMIQKSAKYYLRDGLTQPLQSVTTQNPQVLRLDQWDAQRLANRRVVLVDDVIATGSSIEAAIGLLQQTSASLVGIATLLTEGWDWKTRLDRYKVPIISLGHIPDFDIVDGHPRIRPETL